MLGRSGFAHGCQLHVQVADLSAQVFQRGSLCSQHRVLLLDLALLLFDSFDQERGQEAVVHPLRMLAVLFPIDEFCKLVKALLEAVQIAGNHDDFGIRIQNVRGEKREGIPAHQLGALHVQAHVWVVSCTSWFRMVRRFRLK